MVWDRDLTIFSKLLPDCPCKIYLVFILFHWFEAVLLWDIKFPYVHKNFSAYILFHSFTCYSPDISISISSHLFLVFGCVSPLPLFYFSKLSYEFLYICLYDYKISLPKSMERHENLIVIYLDWKIKLIRI